MNTLFRKSLLALATLSVASCGGSGSSTTTTTTTSTSTTTTEAQKAKFSMGVSDAPVDDALAVYIELESVTLISTDGNQETVIETFTNANGEIVETIKINLLDFQGDSQIKVIDQEQGVEVANGTYEMELTVVDEGSYVILVDDAIEHEIKVPSGRLRLGEFTVNDAAVQVDGVPAYTVEFDLRQSLVLRGNLNNNNGFIIKPHGVRVVSLAGHIDGNVSGEYTNQGECTVYLYGAEATEYGDMYDADDEAFEAPEEDITATAPLATAKVAVDGSYAIGFVPEGSYQLALACSAEIDDNIQYDGLTIPSAGEITPDVQQIGVVANQTTTVDF